MARRPGLNLSDVTARIHKLVADNYKTDTIISVVIAQAPPSTLKALATQWGAEAVSAIERDHAREVEKQQRELLNAEWEKRKAVQSDDTRLVAGRPVSEWKDIQAKREETLFNKTLEEMKPETPMQTVAEVAKFVSTTMRNSGGPTQRQWGCKKTSPAQVKASLHIAQGVLRSLPTPELGDPGRALWQAAQDENPHEISFYARGADCSYDIANALEDFVQDKVEERGYGAAMRFTQAFLVTEFATGDGRRVTWGDATIDDHDSRIEMMTKNAAGILEDVILHEQVIQTLEEAGVLCLNALPPVDTNVGSAV